jgi:hypothetical protein
MKRRARFAAGVLSLACLLVAAPLIGQVQESPVKAGLPVLITSCGQSPGPTRVKLFMQRLKLDFEINTLASAADLAAKQESGAPYRSIIIVTGASLKGMGAAGISMEDELDRTDALIAEARRQGLTIIAAHVEGMDRRAQGAAAGDNSDEQSIDAVCPRADLLMVRQDGNEDGRFTRISSAENIPLVQFVKNMEMADVLTSIFGG